MAEYTYYVDKDYNLLSGQQPGSLPVTLVMDTSPTEQQVLSAISSAKQRAITPQEPAKEPGIAQKTTQYLGEVVSAVSRPASSFVDIVTAPAQAVVREAFREVGFEPPPTLRSTVAERGEFAGAGVLTDAIAGSGEAFSYAITGGQPTRVVANMLSHSLKNGTLKNVLELMGSGRAIDDVAFGAYGGIGGELFAEGGDVLFQGLPEEAKDTFRIAGQVISPIAVSKLVNNIANYATTNLLQAAAPNSQQLKGVANSIYTLLDDLNVGVSRSAGRSLSANLKAFRESELITGKTGNQYKQRIERLETLASEGRLTFRELDAFRSEFAADTVAGGRDGLIAGRLVRVLDDAMDNMTVEPLWKRLGRPATQEELAAYRELGSDADVQGLIRTARSAWRRGSLVEQIDSVFERSLRQAEAKRQEGLKFEYVLRKDMADFVDNAGTNIVLTPSEKKIIDDFISGGTVENLFGFLGGLGVSSTNIANAALISAGAGATAAMATGQTPSASGGVAALTYSTLRGMEYISRIALNRNAQLMRKFIQAGPDGMQVARDYMRFTPRADRSEIELAALLKRNTLDVSALRDSRFANSTFGKNMFAYYDLFGDSLAETNLQDSMGESGRIPRMSQTTQERFARMRGF